MKKTVILIAFLAVVVGISTPVLAQLNAQDNKELAMDAAEVGRKAIITTNVNFTEEESKAFWPIYNMYRRDIKVVNDKLLKLIVTYKENYENLSDEMAAELMTDAMDIEEDRMILRQVYVLDLVGILPMKKVAVLFQLESKIDAAVRYELAEMIPFVKLPDEQANAQLGQ